ncbi:MAG: hypothetical protein JWQ23_4178, partial [Herminiimonas sp.]|nr:hypothetical protein [Herminiimonas sp.]
PLILFIAYYLGLNRYISKDGIRILLVNVFGLVGFIVVPTIIDSKKKQLRKFIPLPKKNNVVATICQLQNLNNSDAWRIFHASCRWSGICAFFIGMWFGTVLTVAFEYWIYPFLINL